MRVFLLLLLLMPSLVHAQDRDRVGVCCGRSDIGFRNNLPPIDSIRFGQQFSGRVRFPQTPTTRHEPEANYPPSFGFYTFEDGGTTKSRNSTSTT